MPFQQYYDESVGLRHGVKAENAAYALTDLDDTGRNLIQIYQWVMNPARDTGLTTIWVDRLRNSICTISDLTAEQMSLLLLTRAAATGERYSAPPLCAAQSSPATFKKCNRVGTDSRILAQSQFPSTPEGVTAAIAWVRATVGR